MSPFPGSSWTCCCCLVVAHHALSSEYSSNLILYQECRGISWSSYRCISLDISGVRYSEVIRLNRVSHSPSMASMIFIDYVRVSHSSRWTKLISSYAVISETSLNGCKQVDIWSTAYSVTIVKMYRFVAPYTLCQRTCYKPATTNHSPRWHTSRLESSRVSKASATFHVHKVYSSLV